VRRRSAALRFSYADLTDPHGLEKALQPDTKLVWVETPSNPLLRLADLRAIAELCRARASSRSPTTPSRALFAASLEFGFDIVVHSVTST